MSKRAFQLQEFAAHASKVNCLRIGRKSGRVMVTGGDDKLVNMWAIGKSNAVMSLEGHQSPVECVTFDTAEELVVAGSSGGTLKLWDLDKQQVVRTLNGHKSNCISVDFHPFGEFFASGSEDTDLKIWDIRRKGCIQTYKGHKKGVNVIRFSPDGRWVISGGEDGVIKLWDLTAGKSLREFKNHTGPITSMEFHPQEFLLATGSTDRTIKFWDLETFEMVSSSDPDVTASKSFTFTPDGSSLLSAYGDALKVWGWEPMRCYDNVAVPWKDVQDINITADQLISCSISQSNVSVWVVYLQKLRPFSKEPIIFDPQSNVKSSLDMSRTSDAIKQLEESQSRVTNLIQQQKVTPSNVVSREPQDALEQFTVREVAPAYSSPVPSHNSNLNSNVIKERTVLPPATAAPSIDVSSFMPKNSSQNVVEPVTSDQVMEELFKSHSTICGILTSRQTNLRVIRGFWSRGDVRECLEAMSRMNDPAVVVDILNVLQDRIPTLFTLDMCVELLPVLHDLLSAQYPDYIATATKTIQSLLGSFGPVIKSVLQAPPSMGVDLSREERVEKCNYCLEIFGRIKRKLESLAATVGKSGQAAREVLPAFKLVPQIE